MEEKGNTDGSEWAETRKCYTSAVERTAGTVRF